MTKILTGTVVSTKMQKTAVVRVTRYVKHPKYGKYLLRAKKYKAHDEPPSGQARCQIGERVQIRETRPRSKDKTFEIIYSS